MNVLNKLSTYSSPRSLSSFRPNFTVHVIGINKVVHKLDAHGTRWEKRLRVGFMYALTIIKQEARRLMRTAYYSKKNVTVGRVSTDILVQSPIWKTGALYRSLESKIIKATHSEFIGEVGTTIYYGRFVHQGFRHYRSGKYIGGKPFLTDAINNKRVEVMRQIHRTKGFSGNYE